ncbi:unknown [Firmicutes bacterium CAG:102]|nr:unknown [Firmicutes bacterium CAG:102]
MLFQCPVKVMLFPCQQICVKLKVVHIILHLAIFVAVCVFLCNLVFYFLKLFLGFRLFLPQLVNLLFNPIVRKVVSEIFCHAPYPSDVIRVVNHIRNCLHVLVKGTQSVIVCLCSLSFQ